MVFIDNNLWYFLIGAILSFIVAVAFHLGTFLTVYFEKHFWLSVITVPLTIIFMIAAGIMKILFLISLVINVVQYLS